MQLRESEERLRLASEAAGFGTYDYKLPRRRGVLVAIVAPHRRPRGRQPLTLERVLEVVTRTTATWSRQHIQGYSSEADRREH